MSLLTAPSPDLETTLPPGTPLVADVALPVPRARLDPHDEPLEPLAGAVDAIDAYAALGIVSEQRRLRVRREVRERLVRANASLPEGFSLVVLDGWRSLALQAYIVKHYAEEAVEGGYVADPTSDAMRPPHVTGGAVDLTVSYEGTPLGLGTDFDAFSPAAHRMAFEVHDGGIRRLRRMFEAAMRTAGFTPYPLEWWHWSYGDDVWAAERGCPAVYDIVDADGHVVG